jgi:hypothetical protein
MKTPEDTINCTLSLPASSRRQQGLEMKLAKLGKGQ